MKNNICILFLVTTAFVSSAQSKKNPKDGLNSSDKSISFEANISTEIIRKNIEYIVAEMNHHKIRIITLQKDSLELSMYLNSGKLVQENIQSGYIKKTDSITPYRDQLSIKNDSIYILNRLISQHIQKENELLESLNWLNKFYTLPFDSLMNYSTEYTVDRDYNVFVKYRNVPKSLNDLKIYFNAKKALDVKYNKERIDLAKIELQKIQQTKTISNLLVKLSNYSKLNNSFKSTIEKIIEVDKTQIAATVVKVQQEKQKIIMLNFAEFYRDYEFEPGVYTYLDRILKKILNDKFNNVDADLRIYLDQL